MIRPTKHLDLDACLVNIAAHVLAKLSVTSVMTYEELLKSVETNLTPRARNDFVLALDLLFVLGQVSYHDETDTICAVSEVTVHGVALPNSDSELSSPKFSEKSNGIAVQRTQGYIEE